MDRGSDNVGNIIPTQKQPISNGPSKNFEVKNSSTDITLLPQKSNKQLLEQEIALHRDRYGTTTNCLSMHKAIDDHTQTGNLEPQYQQMTLEPSINLTSLTPHDHMFEQLEIHQTKDFGFIPKSSLRLYTGPTVTWNEVPHIFQAHALVKNSKLPNYMGCRIPVNSGLNIPKWRHYLANYWDQQLCDLLEYGFPLDFDRECPLISVEQNHTSANDNTSHVSKFIEEELQHQAILGPFNKNPIHMHISPLLV